jgi:hypothetical protein
MIFQLSSLLQLRVLSFSENKIIQFFDFIFNKFISFQIRERRIWDKSRRSKEVQQEGFRVKFTQSLQFLIENYQDTAQSEYSIRQRTGRLAADSGIEERELKYNLL